MLLRYRSHHRVIEFLHWFSAQTAARLGNAGLAGDLHFGRRVEQPLHAFQQATQHLAIRRPHIQRQCDDVIDHHMRRQIAFADAGTIGLLQDLMDFLGGKELGNDAEADVVRDTAAGRQRRNGACH